MIIETCPSHGVGERREGQQLIPGNWLTLEVGRPDGNNTETLRPEWRQESWNLQTDRSHSHPSERTKSSKYISCSYRDLLVCVMCYVSLTLGSAVVQTPVEHAMEQSRAITAADCKVVLHSTSDRYSMKYFTQRHTHI